MKSNFFLKFIVTIMLVSLFDTTFASPDLRFSYSDLDASYTFSEDQIPQGSINFINNSPTDSYQISLYSVDSLTNQFGQIYFKTQKQEQNHLGAWVNFSESSFQVEPQSEKTVQYSIEPENTPTPGIYIGGIAIEDSIITPEENQEQSATQGFSVTISTRNIKKITYQVPGEKNTDFQITDFAHTQTPDSTNFNFRIQNLGNTVLKYRGFIRIANAETDQTIENLVVDEGLILQGNDQDFISKWLDQPTFGNLNAELQLEILEFDPINQGEIPLETINKGPISLQYFPWDDAIRISIIAGITLISLLLLLTSLLLHRSHLKKSLKPYIVQEGDTLGKISEKLHMNWKKIARYNGIKPPYSISPGQEIKVIYPKHWQKTIDQPQSAGENTQ